jgi:Holliday junction DNA helicase RuvA
MIASVSGRVGAVSHDAVVVEVGGGAVGFSVQCTQKTLAGMQVGEQVRLATSLVVREDSLTLYGFADDAQRATFELLQTASGVGPRVAQAAIAVHPPQVIRRAIMQEDLVTLTAVPGIGKKGAQRMVLELRERMTALMLVGVDSHEEMQPTPVASVQAEPLWRQQVREGLLTLGWSTRQAEDATELVAQRHDLAGVNSSAAEDIAAPGVPALLRDAIAILGRAR